MVGAGHLLQRAWPKSMDPQGDGWLTLASLGQEDPAGGEKAGSQSR